VRTYGLFAANPFGVHDFEKDGSKDGSHTLKPGESMAFRYRVLLHKGDEKKGKVGEAFDAYAAEKR
jgi:methane monooxygenase PmoA-like